MESIIPSLTISALREYGVESLPAYEDALTTSCNISPPPYGMAWYGEKYRSVAADPSWLAHSLVMNAAKEGEGSRKLWELAGKASDATVSVQIRNHAIDESRHARLYINMLELTFQNSIEPSLRLELDKLSPGYTKRDHLVKLSSHSKLQIYDEIIQMNIGEIRTRIHQLLLQPVIMVHCDSSMRGRVSSILNSLVQDETKHILYTARLINQAMSEDNTGVLNKLMQRRLDEFNTITLREVGELSFEGA